MARSSTPTDDAVRFSSDTTALSTRPRQAPGDHPDEAKLSSVLREFARTMAADFPVQAILNHLVERIVEILPVTSAGVSLISPGHHPVYVAASDDRALQYEELQAELGEGPCVLAHRTGRPVEIADLRVQEQFPRFTRRAVDAGLIAVFTLPLRADGGHQLGALDLYRETPGPLSPECIEAAQTLADVAAAYLLNSRIREDLRASLDHSRHTALHDVLTGLPARVLLLELLEHAFLRSRRTGRDSAVLFIDLDRFSAVNAAYGRAVGDELLLAVTARLSGMLRPGDTLSRLGDDEFVVICEDLDSPTVATAIGARLVEALAEPFTLASATGLGITASVGVAFTNHGDLTAAQALRNADMAMYQAKRQGGNRHRGSEPRDRQPTDLQVRLGRDLFGATERGELRADYQPIVRAADGRVSGFEALVRWAHPDRGLISPVDFVPLAEQSGLITDIGSWVLGQAWQDLLRWRPSPGHDLVMAVNVSARQVMTAGFARSVMQVLESADTDPSRLTLEVTESVFLRDGDLALQVLTELKNLGVKLALDDFGTGYSSLTYLQRFPVDIVKIDRAFIANLGRDAASHTIVAAVVQLAHGLGMSVVAEGVETEAQHQEIVELGCDSAQGFYFAQPMPADRIYSLMHHGPLDAPGTRLPLLALAGASARS